MIVESPNLAPTLLKIGEVASRSGLSVKTIRYYEEIGLLTPTVERSETGYRLFTPQVLTRLAFIRRSQSLGLSLSEIQHILQVHDQGHLPCAEVRLHLQAKIDGLARQIASLEALKDDLQAVLSSWQDFSQEDLQTERMGAQSGLICPNLQKELA
ncbi:MAG TPA: heavy metal-responsive transcriptional regulator [Synechococcales cyanobacterium M55_K2018_004]|nr:heavy metal-responsive transcriptional regulator [Synechococcales cyanobacterium M55_K2018_004]